jgi:DNA-binding IclR family transcriptional regulator
VLDGDSILYLRTINYVPVRYAAAMGDHAPLHCTAAGKVFLATLSEPTREALIHRITLEKMTENTISSLDRLKTEITVVAKQGYGTADGEEFLQVSGIAAPIRKEDNTVAACLSLWMVRSESSGLQNLVDQVDILLECTQELSHALGWKSATVA